MRWLRPLAIFTATIAVLIGSTVAVPRPVSAERWPGIAARAQAVLDAAIAADGPGCSASFAERGRVVWTGVRGLADLGTGAPITPRTVFDAGSIAKHVTATAALLLVLDGRLGLDDSLAEHLDGFPAWAGTVTVDDLIHQRSGIPEYILLFDAKGYDRYDRITQEMTVDELRAVPALEFAPGSRWAYSNSNYVLLAEVVESVSGKDLQNFLRKRIFRPLDLRMKMDGASDIPRRAVPYELVNGAFQANDGERWEQIGDGALQTTPSDLVRWADNFRKPRVGGPALVALQVENGVETFPGGARYGAGLFLPPDGIIGHPGEWLGFISRFGVSADRQRTMAIFCNNWELDINGMTAELSAMWLRLES